MLDKLNINYSNSNQTIYDPAVKSGIFLSELLIRFMNGLKNEIKSEEERYIYIIKNILFGYCVSEKAMLVTKKLLLLDIYPQITNNIVYKNFLEEDNMKFDIIVGNPPYFLIKKMLQISEKNSNSGCLLIPSSIFLHNKWNKRINDINIQRQYENKITRIVIINSNQAFPGIHIGTSLIQIYWNKNHHSNKFVVEDRITDNIYNHDNIFELHKFSYYPGFKKLKTKIESYCADNNILDNGITSLKNEYKWFFTFPKIRGHLNGESLYNDDFYTYVSKDKQHISRLPKNKLINKDIKNRTTVGFKTKEECQNFINSLELFTIRFCLALNKNNYNLNRGELKIVPFFKDYSKPITEEFVIKELGITQEEYKFIKSIIPEYYLK